MIFLLASLRCALPETPDNCWCRRDLDEDSRCPVHGDPQQSAEHERADRIRNEQNDRDDNPKIL